MNIYVKINAVRYSISYFSYRVNKTADSLELSHNLLCTVLTQDALIIGNTIEFYSDDSLIYSGLLTQSTKFNSKLNVQSVKNSTLPASGTRLIEDIVFFSSSQIRVSRDFSIFPFDTIQTSVGDFIVNTVVHYDIYSEMTYG